MKLLINGEAHDLNVTTIEDVIAHFNLQSGLVATEVDGTIIDRSKWSETNLNDGMKIELVQFVGGG
ncbi:sulfur carrier protein ThiS [Guptibacillus algicola]|uniref:sulfur carrier protein ThiS n=1 Tax=Guptibacillus algicola TaxID=225844 RepID=UPI001CD5E1EC|nr:sulfur carrier protein ThiS [Alkalihalobacillus algicola]MCA0986024.1 sulfur carrier protein ThiS [Alkalihalobacillus algicola]